MLMIDDMCNMSNCMDCIKPDDFETFYVHFSATIYGTKDGVKDDDSRYRIFNTNLEDLTDGIIPDSVWEREIKLTIY